MASERTLYTALAIFGDPDFRASRQERTPGSRAEWDARAATFAAMDQEGRFADTSGHPLTPEEQDEFDTIAAAVFKMYNTQQGE